MHPQQMNLFPTIHLPWLQNVAEHFVNRNVTKTISQGETPRSLIHQHPSPPFLEQHEIYSPCLDLFMCQLPFPVHLVWEEERLE